MIESSTHFAKLELAIAEANILIEDLPPHDVRNRTDQLKLKSYVLLCHAAIEQYLESVSKQVLSNCFSLYKADGVVRDPLLSACAYYNIPMTLIDANSAQVVNIRDVLSSLFGRAVKEHSQSLEGVHGIKTKDQEAIMMPIGMNIFDFDKLLCQNLNSFGSKRGLFAHTFGLQTVPPRAGQQSTVNQLIKLLLPLDNELCGRHQVCYQ